MLSPLQPTLPAIVGFGPAAWPIHDGSAPTKDSPGEPVASIGLPTPFGQFGRISRPQILELLLAWAPGLGPFPKPPAPPVFGRAAKARNPALAGPAHRPAKFGHL